MEVLLEKNINEYMEFLASPEKGTTPVVLLNILSGINIIENVCNNMYEDPELKSLQPKMKITFDILKIYKDKVGVNIQSYLKSSKDLTALVLKATKKDLPVKVISAKVDVLLESSKLASNLLKQNLELIDNIKPELYLKLLQGVTCLKTSIDMALVQLNNLLRFIKSVKEEKDVKKNVAKIESEYQKAYMVLYNRILDLFEKGDFVYIG